MLRIPIIISCQRCDSIRINKLSDGQTTSFFQHAPSFSFSLKACDLLQPCVFVCVAPMPLPPALSAGAVSQSVRGGHYP